jgi:thymidylate kinase
VRTSEQWSSTLLEQVFAGLDDQGVRWSVLRGAGDLKNAERDVDLLVSVDDLPVFEEVVSALGGVRLPQWLQGWHRFYWFRPPQLSRPGLMLDVVTTLTYGRDGRLPTDLAAVALDRRIRRGTRYELAPTDTFWTVMLHCLLDKGRFKERRIRELEAALPDLVFPSEGEVIVASQCPEGWSPERLVECVGRGDWESLYWLTASLSGGGKNDHVTPKRQTGREGSGTIQTAKRHLPQRNSLGGNVAKAAYGATWTISRRAKSGPGGAMNTGRNPMSETKTVGAVAGSSARRSERRAPIRISVSGLDGSGKSRQTAALAANLGEERETELVWVPFDIWPGSMLKLLPTRVRVHLGPRGRMDADANLTAEQLATRASEAEAIAAQPQGPTKLVPRMFWWTVATLAAVSAGTSLRRRMNRMTAEVVVIDRYRLDTIVKVQTWYPSVSRTWLAHIVLRLAPAPDVECLLRVEGAEAYARKPEQYSALQLARQARMYDELVANVPGTVVVDGREAPEDVTEALWRLASSALHGR